MNTKNTAVILARVSSKSQEDEGYSLDSQLKLLQGYCESNDLRVVRVFKIAETASKQQSRKIFNELLTYLTDNNVYNLTVEKTDRLTRNLRDAVSIDDWLELDKDRMLHAVKENLRLHKESKSDVKFMWNIHLAVAKKYTDNLREEAMKGWAEKLAQGWLPSRPPIGYMTAIQNGKRVHVPDPKKSKVIKKAFELYVQGSESTATVWSFLEQAHITTYTGRPLTKSAVHLLLQNPYYMGIIQFNGEKYPGSHQPIISKQLYKSVQTKMHSGRAVKQRRHDVALRNVLTCGYCSKSITWERQKGHLYGACQRDLVECKQNKYLREELVHEVLIEKLDKLISPSPTVVQWLVNRLENEFNASKATVIEYKQSLETRITRLEKMDEMLYDDKLAGDITKERYETKHTDIAKQVEELKEELLVADATSETKHREAIGLIQLTQHAKEQYLDTDLANDDKRTILTELFESVTYISNSVSVKYTKFVEMIAEKSAISKEIMEDIEMLNRTSDNSKSNSSQETKNNAEIALRPVWQGHEESNFDLRFWRPTY